MFYALRQYSLPLLLAVGLHAAAVWSLMQGWNPEKELLNVIKPQTVVANLVVIEPKAKPPPPKVDQAALKRQQELKRQRELEAQNAAEQKKLEAERLERERLEKERVDAEAAKKQAEELARQERLARLSELAQSSLEQAIAEESQNLAAGSEEAVVRSFHAVIYDQVRRNWSRPPSSRTGMQARLLVELIPTGEVVTVTVVDGSGNGAFDRSAENAVRQAGRFDVPEDNALFEKHFRRFYLLFQPEDLLR